MIFYLKSVDKNYQNDENRQPSIKHPMGKTIETLSNMNKISTPLASPAPTQPPQMPQRYVPARQISQENNQTRIPSVSNRSALNSVSSNLQVFLIRLFFYLILKNFSKTIFILGYSSS